MAENQRPSDNRGIVEHWKRIGPQLEAIRRQELRHYDFEANREIIDSLFQIGVALGPPRTSSGLIEWVRKLQKAYERGV